MRDLHQLIPIIAVFRKSVLSLCLSLPIVTGCLLRASIDDRIVLKIGPLEVSEYVVQKRFKPFREGLPSGDADNTERISDWFEDFLVNQVITAKAVSERYATRPDVVAAVDRMERHMLSAVNGPYYQLILQDAVSSEAEIRKLYEEDPQTNASVPFEDYFRMIQTKELQEAIEKHRNTVLDNVQFEAEQENCDKLRERLIKLPLVPADIPIGLVEGKEDLLLASYIQDGKPYSVMASEWIRYFDLLFVRAIPTRDVALKRSIENMIIAAIDIETARALGLDQEPKFVEDRKHYLNAQALEWFERERLIPEISISEEVIAAFYLQHGKAFSRSIAAKGTLFRFENKEAAMRWLQSYRLNERNDQLADSVEEVEVTQDQPIPSLEALTHQILNTPKGQLIGPISTKDYVLIFLKQSSKREQIPMEEMTDYIVETLTRDRLHTLEKELAPEYCKTFEIEDNIAYENYGATTVKNPWSD